MPTSDIVAEVFRLLPGEWILAMDHAGSVSKATRAEDGLELRLQTIDDTLLRVDPILPRTSQRTADPDDWFDVHHGAMPVPARITLTRGAPLVAERLARGLLVEAEALHRVVQEVVRIEREPELARDKLIAALLASTYALKVTEHPDGSREFRLSGEFAGTLSVRRDGTARILMQAVPADVATALIDALPSHAAHHVRHPLPHYERPAGVARRGHMAGAPAGSPALSTTREQVLAALAADPSANQSSVATALGITRQAVSQHVKALRQQGLLPDPASDDPAP